MSRVRSVVIVIGGLIMLLTTVVTTYFGLLSFGVVEGEAQQITITLDSMDKKYDGTPLNSTTYSYDESDLDPEHTLEVYFLNEITNVGSVDIRANVVIRDKDGKDVTKRYDVVIENSTFNIIPRQVNITYNSNSKEYDGTPLEQTTYTISGDGLVNGHKLVNIFNNSVVNVGDRELVNATPSIIAENGADVSSNYSINIQSASAYLEITQRKAKIEINNYEKDYDGEGVYVNNIRYQVSGLLSGHTFEFTDYFEDTLLGLDSIAEDGYHIVELNENSYDIYDLSGKSVKDCYDSLFTTFNVTINPNKIDDNVTIIKDYNGESHKESIINQLNIKYGSKLNGSNITDIKLFDGEVVFDDYTNAIDNKILKLGLEITNQSGIRIDENYDTNITLTLTINKRKLELYGYSTEKEYSEESISLEDEIDENKTSGLLPEHTVSITYKDLTDINKIGTYPTEVEDIKEDIEIYFDGEDVTSNYDIRYYKGIVTIYQKIVTVNLGQLTKKYDGKAFGSKDLKEFISKSKNEDIKTIAEANTFELPDDYINVDDSFEKLITTELLIYNSDGEINRNYKVEATYSIKITPIDLNLYNNKPIPLGKKGLLTKIYDGKAIVLAESDYSVLLEALHSNKVFEKFDITNVELDKEYINVDDTNILEKDKATLISQDATKLSSVDYTKYLNSINATIVDENGKDVSANFNITAAYAVLINPLPIYVTSNVNKTYDGEVVTPENISIVDGAKIYDQNDKLGGFKMTADMLAAYRQFTKNYKVSFTAYTNKDKDGKEIDLLNAGVKSTTMDISTISLTSIDGSSLTADDVAHNNYSYVDLGSVVVIKPAEIIVDLGELTKVEDDDALALGNKEVLKITKALPLGNKVKSASFSKYRVYKTVEQSTTETQTDILSCEITSNDKDVSGNYIIKANYTVKITREITVKLDTILTNVYDGKALELSQKEIDTIAELIVLPDGFEIKNIKLAEEYINAQTWKEAKTVELSYEVYKGTEDWTEYFDISLTCKVDITPLEIKVTSSASKVYDGNAITPDVVDIISAESLDKEDKLPLEQYDAYKLFENNYKITATSYVNDGKIDLVNVGKPNAKLDLTSIKVTTIDGLDVALSELSNYKFVEGEQSDVEILVYEVDVNLGELTKVEDENALTLTYKEIDIIQNALSNGFELESAELPVEYKAVYDSTYDYVTNTLICTITKDEKEVQSNIKINATYNVIITKDINVELDNTLIKVYDGKALELSEEEINNIISIMGINPEFEVKSIKLTQEYIDVQTWEEANTLEVICEIYKGDENWSEYFNVSLTYKVDITPRVIELTSNVTKIYDGTIATPDQIVVQDQTPDYDDIYNWLSNNYEIIVDSFVDSYVNVGSYITKLNLAGENAITIRNKETNELASQTLLDNLKFESLDCNVTINQLQINLDEIVEIADYIKTYDGQAVSMTETVDDGGNPLLGLLTNEQVIIIESYIKSKLSDDCNVELKIAKEYKNVCDEIAAYTLFDIDVASNIEIITAAKVVINKFVLELGATDRDISVNLMPLNPIVDTGYNHLSLMGSNLYTIIKTGENLKYSSVSYDKNYVYVADSTEEAKLKFNKLEILDESGNSTIDNYEIVYLNSKITINKYSLTLNVSGANTVVHQYNGNRVDATKYSFKVEGTSAEINNIKTRIQIVPVDFVQDYVNVSDSYAYTNKYADIIVKLMYNGLDVTENFNIKSVIKIEITPIRFTANGIEFTNKTYDGNEYVISSNDVKAVEQRLLMNNILVNGHRIKEITLKNSAKDAKPYVNTGLNLTIVDVNGNDVTNNYNLTITSTFLINKVKINYSMTVNKEYDKQAAVIDLIDVYNMIGIIPTNASKTTPYVNADTYAIKYYQTDLLSGNDVNNYEIIVSVNLVISKVKLVHTITVNKAYDESVATVDLSEVYTMLGLSIPADHIRSTGYTNAGSHSITYNEEQLLNFADANNYDITAIVNVNISKKVINKNITVAKEYDGLAATVDLSEVYTMVGKAAPASPTVTNYINAGSYTVSYDEATFLSGVEANNYDITVTVSVNISKKVINKNITVAKEYDGSAATVDLSEVYTMVGKAAPASPTVTNYINAGSYTVSYDEATFLSGVEAKNYDVTVTVSVNISKKVINKNITIAKEYDGLAVTVDLKDVYTMIGINNPINYIETTECKNVGSYHITYDETRFLDSTSAKNYDITVSVSINISKKMISDKATANAVLVDGKVIINLREIFNNPDLPASYYVPEVTTTGAHAVFITDKDLGLSSNYFIQLYITLRVTN